MTKPTHAHPHVYALLLALVACTSACSLAFQDSVRSRSVYCSTSRFWYISDVVIAGGMVAAASRTDAPGIAYLAPGVFAGSALLGIYKRHHCESFRASASPEVWAAASENERRREEARRAEAARQAEYQARANAAAAAAAEQWAAQQAAAQQAAAQQAQQQAQQQPPAPPVPENRWTPAPTPAPARQVEPTIQVQRTTVPRSSMAARSHAECDQWLKLPPVDPKDPFGNAQKMMQINRETCYRCTDQGKTLSIYRLPPAFETSCD